MFGRIVGTLLEMSLVITVVFGISFMLLKKYAYFYEKYDIRKKFWSIAAKTKMRYILTYTLFIIILLYLGLWATYFEFHIFRFLVWYFVMLGIGSLEPHRFCNYKQLHNKYAKKSGSKRKK